MESNKSVEHVVVDSGGFFRNADICAIGEKIYSLPEVVKEIRDRATRQRLKVLPYDIIFRQPTPEAIKYVTDFAKQSGDYKSLSSVDLKVLGLTYQLEKENVGTDHIKSKPDKKAQWSVTMGSLQKSTDIAGFYLSKKPSKSESMSENLPSEEPDITENVPANSSEVTEIVPPESSEVTDEGIVDDHVSCIDSLSESRTTHEKDSSSDTVKNEPSQSLNKTSEELHRSEINNLSSQQPGDESVSHSKYIDKEGDTLPDELLCEGSDDEEEGDSSEEDSDEDSDDEGWITPSNIHELQKKSGDSMQKVRVTVGCITTDFAMQNVLLQMGLNAISVDGMLIKKAKSYVFRCFGCMKITTDVTKDFCPHCGNKTLQRVSMSVDEDGAIRYFLSRRKPVSTRGMKYSMPLPKGGKHANNPIIVEDQPLPQQRLSRKAKQRMDALDPDYITGQSPFTVNDINSRASNLGIHCNKQNKWNKRNPNEVKKYRGRRK